MTENGPHAWQMAEDGGVITIPARVANASGLDVEDARIVRDLVHEWQVHLSANLVRHEYYLMHNSLVDLGISVPPELKNLDAACGWAKKCVDVMVEHSKFDGYTCDDQETADLLDTICRRNKMRTLYRKAATSAFEQSFSLFVVTQDDNKKARISAYPPSACGVLWDDARQEIAAAMIVVSVMKERGIPTDVPDWIDVLTSDNLIRIRLNYSTRKWETEYIPHSLGRVPAFAAAYESTLMRPFGSSRITPEVMSLIDCAVRENVNEEIASAFAASPQKYLLGTDGDAFQSTSRWDAYIGSIFNVDMTEDGTTPQFGQLAQPSMQPLTDHFRNLCGRMSAATGVHVSQFGQVHDNPSSSDAIYAENEPLILKVKDWNDDAGDTLADVAFACIATEHGETFDEVRDNGPAIFARFRNPAMPTLAQQTDSSVKIASVVEGFAGTDTFWEMNGLSQEERNRVMSEVESKKAKTTSDAVLASMFGE